jgi:UDP-glucose 4-epimerase
MNNYDFNGKTILIIGGAGFVGFELIKQLSLYASCRLIVVDNDKNRLSELNLPISQKYCFDGSETARLATVMSDENVDGVIHLAANSDIRSGSISSDLDFRNTLTPTLSLSEIVKSKTLNFVMFSSTSAVYGNTEKPISLNSNDYKIPISNYGWAKLASEYALRLATKESSTPFILTRFPNVVGPNPTHGVLYDFKKKLKSKNKVFEILGNGEQTKPYLHVEDLCKVLIRAISISLSKPETELNIGPGDSINLKDIVRIVLEITGLNYEPKFGTSSFGWVGDVPNYMYSDNLPKEYSDIVMRKSAVAIHDAFSGSWVD